MKKTRRTKDEGMVQAAGGRSSWKVKLVLLFCWVFLVLYPLPWLLAVSMYRLYRPPLDSVVVTEMAEQMQGKTAAEIEAFVYQALPYRFDWEVHGMPWYFPTLDEALKKGYGDCKARYLLFVSLLENMNIPYEQRISPTHIWVDYEGKNSTPVENAQVTLRKVDQHGVAKWQLPRIDLARSWNSFVQGFWEVMPLSRKITMVVGIPVVLAATSLSAHNRNIVLPP